MSLIATLWQDVSLMGFFLIFFFGNNGALCHRGIWYIRLWIPDSSFNGGYSQFIRTWVLLLPFWPVHCHQSKCKGVGTRWHWTLAQHETSRLTIRQVVSKLLWKIYPGYLKHFIWRWSLKRARLSVITTLSMLGQLNQKVNLQLWWTFARNSLGNNLSICLEVCLKPVWWSDLSCLLCFLPCLTSLTWWN